MQQFFLAKIELLMKLLLGFSFFFEMKFSDLSLQAFVKAWQMACATPKSVLLVPPGRRYLVNATKFKGPCEDRLVIQVMSMQFEI